MTQSDERQPRSVARTSVMILATAGSEARPMPVKIRNLSPTGSMIESSIDLPPTDALMLMRGPLSVRGRIIWSEGVKSGIKFNRSIDVGQWIKKSA